MHLEGDLSFTLLSLSVCEVDGSLSESRLELMRMDQSAVTESNRPMCPPPGLEDPNHVTEHPTAPTTTLTGHQNNSRRPIPGRRRTLSQTSTAAPLPLEDGSNRSLDLDTVSEGTDETGFSENKWPRTSEFPVTSSPDREVLEPTDSSETMPGVSSAISDAAIESVNRNRMLDFGNTTCKRLHPEPVIERERSQSPEAHPAALLVGTWYYLTPDSSGALVSEVVDRRDLALERTHAPGHHFTPTRPTGGHDTGFDHAMENNVFLARSSDEEGLHEVLRGEGPASVGSSGRGRRGRELDRHGEGRQLHRERGNGREDEVESGTGHEERMPQDRRFPLLVDRDFSEPAPLLENPCNCSLSKIGCESRSSTSDK